MRCLECNVDLGENVKVCPLCGAKASEEKPVLEGMRVAEYPEYGELRPLKYYIKKNDVGNSCFNECNTCCGIVP